MNSRDNVREPSSHFNYEGFTVAGPAYIPGLFSGSKENLFFFWSEECEQQLNQPRNQYPVKQQPNPTAIPGSNAYDTNFLRPYQGYGDIDFEGFDATTNYNSLQVKAGRQFASGLSPDGGRVSKMEIPG